MTFANGLEDEMTVNVTDFYPFNQTSYFHSYCPIATYYYTSNQTGVEDVSSSRL